LDDYFLAASAAVIVASVVILASLLTRYNRLVQEADRSARLAKDVWDSMSSRFSVVDGRIIDLMAKSDVLSSRLGLSPVVTSQARSVPTSAAVQDKSSRPMQSVRNTESGIVGDGTETETKVLRLLAEGPKSSAEIKEWVGRSREHTARLMKTLFDRGLVLRNDRNKPYVYEITESGRSYVAS
jgi:CRP-like cAMP-binding protein